jgi:type I restriction enzyme, S subunit
MRECDWGCVYLRNLTSKIGSDTTPRSGSNNYKSEGISLIRSQNILDFNFSIEGLAFIDDEQAEELSNVNVKEGDVLLNRLVYHWYGVTVDRYMEELLQGYHTQNG